MRRAGGCPPQPECPDPILGCPAACPGRMCLARRSTSWLQQQTVYGSLPRCPPARASDAARSSRATLRQPTNHPVCLPECTKSAAAYAAARSTNSCSLAASRPHHSRSTAKMPRSFQSPCGTCMMACNPCLSIPRGTLVVAASQLACPHQMAYRNDYSTAARLPGSRCSGCPPWT